MNKEDIIFKLIGYIEDCFSLSSVSLSEHSTLADFEPDELDLNLFGMEICMDFAVVIEEVYGDKLLTTPIYEIAEYIKKNGIQNKNN